MCLKSIILSVNHCVALFITWYVALRDIGKTELFKGIIQTWFNLTLLFCKALPISLYSSSNLKFMKKDDLSWYLTSVYPAKSVLKYRE